MKSLVVFGCSTSIEYRWCLFPLNRSFTKPFGTHTFYQRGGGVGRTPPAISKNVVTMNVKFCRVLKASSNFLELLKLLT